MDSKSDTCTIKHVLKLAESISIGIFLHSQHLTLFFAFCGIFPYLGLEKSMEIHTVGLDIHSIIDSLFGQENLTKVDI